MFDSSKPKCKRGHEMRIKQECTCKKGQSEKCYKCHLEDYHRDLPAKGASKKVEPTIP